MKASILNREFQHPSDGWYQIEASGEHPNVRANVVQVINQESAQSIASRFNADASAGKLRHGSEMLIDHEHFSDDPARESRAYGWLYELQPRADGIYGRIRWSKTGQDAVDGGDYRFFSTEYSPNDLKVLNSAQSPRRVLPMRLDGLSLTNMNNNRGQKPITNRSLSKVDLISETRIWAAGELATAATHFQNSYGMDRENALSTARFFNRGLVRIAGIDQGEPEASTPEICNRFTGLVNLYQAAHQLTFHVAWNQVASMEKEIYLAMCQSQ